MSQKLKICLIGLLSLTLPTSSILSNDSSRNKVSRFFSLDITNGSALKTNELAKNGPFYSSAALRYCIGSTGESWEDIAYKMPYYGIGIYAASFYEKSDELGNPISLYLLGGSTIHQFNKRLGINYEWNLGLSMGWKPFDPVDNPYNDAIATESNVHLALKINTEYALTKHLNLTTGLAFTHFSNGAARMPNKGMNFVGVYVDLSYNFNQIDKRILLDNNVQIAPPKMPKRIDHEIGFITTSRQIEFPSLDYVDRTFKVLGANYGLMFANGYKYKWGPQIDIVYDESSQAKAVEVDGRTHIALGDFNSRFSAGLSLKGEIAQPLLTFFANLGYSIWHQHHVDDRFYQIIGIKLYLKENLFATFGVKATDFSKAQYLYWSFGYTISSFRHRESQK